jgi:hypothetical protein
MNVFRNLIILLIAVLFGWNLNGQTNITTLQGKGVILTCGLNSNELQWQQSHDNVNWGNISNGTHDSLLVVPQQNTYYRAIIGKTDCSSISDVYYVKIQNRPEEISEYSYVHTPLTELFSCFHQLNGSYLVECQVKQRYTLNWTYLNTGLGVVISDSPYFLPKDGTSYTTSDSYVPYVGLGNSWYFDTRYGNFSNISLYIYTFDTNHIYSIGKVITIPIVSNSFSPSYQSTCTCN